MKFYIMTLFPDMVLQGLNTSIIGRAMDKGILSIEAVNIRDYAFNKHNSVDDYPYGGGAGMLMQAEPVYQCYQAIIDKIHTQGGADSELCVEKKKPRVLYMSPQGQTFTQGMAEELAHEEELIFLCGLNIIFFTIWSVQNISFIHFLVKKLFTNNGLKN